MAEKSDSSEETSCLRRDVTTDELFVSLRDIKIICLNNIDYYEYKNGYQSESILKTYKLLYEHIDKGIQPGSKRLSSLVYQYDLNEDTPANGFRSFLIVLTKYCQRILTTARYLTDNRESLFFRWSYYTKELESYVIALGQLRALLFYMEKIQSFCLDGNLFPDEDTLNDSEFSIAMKYMLDVESLSQEPFYGKCLGLQYCESLLQPLNTVSLIMASYGEGYLRSSSIMKLASSFISGSKFLLDPDLRAQQIIDLTRGPNGGIEFCKSFWRIAEHEMLRQLPLFVCPSVELDKVIVLEPVTVELPSAEDNDVTVRITPPVAHHGPSPVYTRLISYKLRQGQDLLLGTNVSSGKPLQPRSDSLVIHCHGGGFVSQSSASHQVYLRSWAKRIGCPILCIDYSLAPESPFPRQLEETMYAYSWALKNAHSLGSSARRVCMAGDSAGANLIVSMCMRAAEYGIRTPDGVLSTYGCFLTRYCPSPARLLAFLDPIIPLGVLATVLGAYAGVSERAGAERGGGMEMRMRNKPQYDPPRGGAVESREQPPTVNGDAGKHGAPAGDRYTVNRAAEANGIPLNAAKTTAADRTDLTLPGSVPQYAFTRHFAQSPVLELRNIHITRNPYMSPYLATDDMLRTLPPIHMIACHLDPLLDDSIMLAKRLVKLEKQVTLDVLDDLPHGFLNFVLVCREAKQASQRCIQALRNLLQLDDWQTCEDSDTSSLSAAQG